MRKRIGVLGGSFNPIHQGHIRLGEMALKEAGLDRIIYLPANISPFKINKKQIPEQHRLNMLKIAQKQYPFMEISTLEIDTDEISYTFLTMKKLKKFYGDNLYFILGSDSYMELEAWYKGIDLLKSTSFIVGRRGSMSLGLAQHMSKYYKNEYGTETVILSEPILPISSTDIRIRAAYGERLDTLVPESIEIYIKEHNLYGYGAAKK